MNSLPSHGYIFFRIAQTLREAYLIQPRPPASARRTPSQAHAVAIRARHSDLSVGPSWRFSTVGWGRRKPALLNVRNQILWTPPQLSCLSFRGLTPLLALPSGRYNGSRTTHHRCPHEDPRIIGDELVNGDFVPPVNNLAPIARTLCKCERCGEVSWSGPGVPLWYHRPNLEEQQLIAKLQELDD